MQQYPVNEIFQSLQGEGFFTGLPSIFIRFQGCGIGCSWCDTKHTWVVDIEKIIPIKHVCSPEKKNNTWALMSAQQIKEILATQKYQAKHIIITGGEPCQYNLLTLTDFFHQQGYGTQIETSGTLPIQVSDQTWVTVSPKIGMKGGLKVQRATLERANEIKHPVIDEADIQSLDHLLSDLDIKNKQVSLQPVSQSKSATELAIRICLERNWRLSLQTHKYLNIR